MHLYIDKKIKIYFYIFLFLLLSTITNNKILKTSNIYTIKKIEINNLEIKLKKKIEKSLYDLFDQNIFTINKKEINDKLNKINFIDTVSIKKKFPSTLIVDVNKADLLVKTNINNQIFLIGSNGKLIDIGLVTLKKDLPIFFGNFEKDKFFNFLFYLEKTNFKLIDFKSLYLFPSGRWDIETKKQIKIKLPINNLESSLNLVEKIIEKHGDKKKYTIDLRIKNQVILSDE